MAPLVLCVFVFVYAGINFNYDDLARGVVQQAIQDKCRDALPYLFE